MSKDKLNTLARQDQQIKVCLLGATFGTENMGVGALTAGIIESIFYRWPDARIVLLDYANEASIYYYKTDDRFIPVPTLNIRFSKKFYLKNNIIFLTLLSLIVRFVPLDNLRIKIISGNPYLKELCESHIIASIAAGDSFSDIYGWKQFLYFALPQLLTILLRKKLFLLPQTLGPFKRKIVKLLAYYILNNATRIYSRDYEGMLELKACLPANAATKKLKFCYDVGFVLQPIMPDSLDVQDLLNEVKRDSCVVGFNISGLLFMGGYTKDNMFGLRIDYENLVYHIIDVMLHKKNVIVLLVPHVFGDEQSFKGESDSVVCEKVYNILKNKFPKRIFSVSGKYNQNEIKYFIGMCHFFIGSRMHACIAALSQNIPAVSIAYSKKFFGVMKTIGLESLVADPREMEKDHIMSLINNAYDHRVEISNNLEKKMPDVKKLVLNLFSDADILISDDDCFS